jgi:octanoyl-[GcvH]:protein N-octanoyltransferase
VRVFQPGAAVQFGRLDRRRPGFSRACAAAEAHGFTPIIRVVGGLAAAHDGGSIVFDEFLRSGVESIHDRFELASARLVRALRSVGSDARVGRIPGEYCPGDHSINVGGVVKVAGTAQRVVRGAALVSTVIVCSHGDRIRAVLEDVYAALDLDWDPATAGDLGVPAREVETALRAEWAEAAFVDGRDDETQALAAELVADHRV